MADITFETTVDDAVADVLPKLRPLLGSRIRVTAREAAPAPPRTGITLDDFLIRRLKRPAGVEPVDLEGMERAISAGALGEDV